MTRTETSRIAQGTYPPPLRNCLSSTHPAFTSNSHPLKYTLFSQSSFPPEVRRLCRRCFMEREEKCHSPGNCNACEMVEDSSLFTSRGSHLTLAKAAYLVDRNGLEEFLPLPAVSNFLCAASTGPLPHKDTACLPGNYLEWEPALSRGSL